MQNNSIYQTSLSKKLFKLRSFCGMVMASVSLSGGDGQKSLA